MPRALRLATWLFFSLTLYDLFAVATKPFLHLYDLGDHSFVVVCVLFVILHCTLLEGPRRTAIFFTISALVSFTLEEIGVRTGLIYGPYHYSAMLGAKLGHVPIIIPLAWFMMIYPAWLVARTILTGLPLHTLPGRTAHALLAAWVVSSWDTVMDPGMAVAGNWVWERGGAYFGVPRHNYLGWLLTTFIVYFLASWLWRDPHTHTQEARLFAALPIFLYAAIGTRYIFYVEIPAIQVIALFTMGTPSLVAILRTALPPVDPLGNRHHKQSRRQKS